MRQESGHARVEELSIHLHKVVADKLRDNPPAVLETARNNIDRWRRNNPGGRAGSYFDRWEALLDGPLDELLAFMVSPSQDARAMRQAAPFTGVLSNKERWEVIHSFTEDWERRHHHASRPVGAHNPS